MEEVRTTGIFTICMDCTTDLFHADQLSLILQYVNSDCDVVERLLTVERVEDSTAENVFTKLQNILKSMKKDFSL